MNLRCLLSFHKWNMYQGYGQIKPHSRAVCERCGKKYKELIGGKDE